MSQPETITLRLAAEWPPKAAQQAFTAQLAELGITVPVRHHVEELGEIIDAAGKDILQVDPLGIRDDQEVGRLAELFALAINTMAGVSTIEPAAPSESAEGPRLQDLVERANARLAAMTQEERASHDKAQRENYVRAFTTPCEHGVLDFEQCPDCRKGVRHVPV